MTRINHNIPAMITGRQLQKNDEMLATSIQRLSTGLRINRSADDVAGLAVSEKIRTQIRGTAQARRNAGDGSALLQIADGALNEITNVLQRMRELAIQSANDTLGTVERVFVDREFQSLMAEVGRIAAATQYNGVTLLDGAPNSFGSTGGTASILHVGANFNSGGVLGAIDILTVHITPVTLGALGLTLGGTAVTTGASSLNALNAVDSAIRSVNAVRSEMGATVNRLDEAVANLQIQETNMTSAESMIRDTDFATEVGEMTRAQILQQSATAMLSQANQSPQNVLQLLQH